MSSRWGRKRPQTPLGFAKSWNRIALACALSQAALLAGCSGNVQCESCGGGSGGASSASSVSASTGPACASTTGELHGAVALFTAPGDKDSLPAPKALLDLRQKPEDVPIHAMADDQASYTVELPEGSWIVGGESADTYCTTFMPKTALVEACGSTKLDVVLEACVN